MEYTQIKLRYEDSQAGGEFSTVGVKVPRRTRVGDLSKHLADCVAPSDISCCNRICDAGEFFQEGFLYATYSPVTRSEIRTCVERIGGEIVNTS